MGATQRGSGEWEPAERPVPPLVLPPLVLPPPLRRCRGPLLPPQRTPLRAPLVSLPLPVGKGDVCWGLSRVLTRQGCCLFVVRRWQGAAAACCTAGSGAACTAVLKPAAPAEAAQATGSGESQDPFQQASHVLSVGKAAGVLLYHVQEGFSAELVKQGVAGA